MFKINYTELYFSNRKLSILNSEIHIIIELRKILNRMPIARFKYILMRGFYRLIIGSGA